MEKIIVFKNKLLKFAEKIKSTLPHLKIYIKVDKNKKTIFLKINRENKPTIEEIKKIEVLTKIFFEDYILKIH